MLDIKELKKRILSADNVLIIPHINPDPDALGSALGLKWIFTQLNKRSSIICDNEVSEKICGYLDINTELDELNAPGHFDYIISVDTASESMLGEKFKEHNIDLAVDHHYTNSLYARETYLDASAAATGEIIFDLAQELGLSPDRDFAKYIYCAIVCDSGAFRFSGTTPKTMRVAAELIETGFDFAKLNRLIFENKSLEELAIERLAYNNLKLYANGKIAVINITRELKKAAGLEDCRLEGLSNMPRVIAGVEVGILIKEVEQREFKISLRSSDYVNVAEVAAQFEGGGHIRAAGCKIIAPPDLDKPHENIERQLIEKIESVL